MERNKRYHLCNVEISKLNRSKHIKTKKHLDNLRSEEKHCRICNVLIREHEWNNHLKSITHKNKRKLFQNKLKEKVKSFNIRKQRLRHFNNLDFETDDYIVMKSEEALEGCFLTLQVRPKHEINNVDILIQELPNLFNEIKKKVCWNKIAISFIW